MSEEKKSDDKNKLDHPIHSEARQEARMDETSLIRSNAVTPIRSIRHVPARVPVDAVWDV